jgi:peptide/nickel transport system substrate-binding protein
MRKVWELWDQVQVEPDTDARNALFKEMMDLNKENLWRVGTCGESPSVVITTNQFRNVPEGIITDDPLRAIGLAQPPQFFIEA